MRREVRIVTEADLRRRPEPNLSAGPVAAAIVADMARLRRAEAGLDVRSGDPMAEGRAYAP